MNVTEMGRLEELDRDFIRHEATCKAEYESISRRLDRLEKILITVAGTLILYFGAGFLELIKNSGMH